MWAPAIQLSPSEPSCCSGCSHASEQERWWSPYSTANSKEFGSSNWATGAVWETYSLGLIAPIWGSKMRNKSVYFIGVSGREATKFFASGRSSIWHRAHVGPYIQRVGHMESSMSFKTWSLLTGRFWRGGLLIVFVRTDVCKKLNLRMTKDNLRIADYQMWKDQGIG